MDKETKAYIDQKAKAVAELLMKHHNALQAHTPSTMLTYEDLLSSLDISEEPDATAISFFEAEEPKEKEYEHPTTHPASMILTDPQHRFITDLQLAEFGTNRVSNSTLKKELKDHTKELKTYLNKNLNDLLNSKNVAQNLRLIASIVSQDENLSTVLDILQNKTDFAAFEKHVEDKDIHLTEDDAFLLDTLSVFLTVGIADWEATEDAPNYIANKPSALPADGGNADTIDGYHKEELLKNKRTHTIVIGCKESHLTEDDVDYLCDGENDKDIIQSAIDSLRGYGGSIYLREGTYHCGALELYSGNAPVSICGCGNATILKCNESDIHIRSNITLSNLSIKDANLIMNGDSSKILDCTISGSLYFGELNKCRISRNTLKNGTLTYASVQIYNCIFSDNIFERYIYTEYNGGNNLFVNNIKVF